MPSIPYSVSGTIKDENGAALNNATVEVYNATTREYVSVLSVSGEFMIDLAKFASGYNNLDVCFLRAWSENPHRYTLDYRFIVNTVVGLYERNLVAFYLINRIKETDPKDVLQEAYDPVSGALKTQAVDTTGASSSYTQMMENGDDGMTYQGEARPGTLTSTTGWRIKKLTYENSRVVKIEWAEGDPSFGYVWDSRAGYNYA